MSLKQKPQAEKKEAEKENRPVDYPAIKDMQEEAWEEEPCLLFTVYDEKDNVVRRLYARPNSGINRIVWDFRYPSSSPADKDEDKFKNQSSGILAMPGTYKVAMGKVVQGEYTELQAAKTFQARLLGEEDKEQDAEIIAFRKKMSELTRAFRGANKVARKTQDKIDYMLNALKNTPAETEELRVKVLTVKDELRDILIAFNGSKVISELNENQPPSIGSRIGAISWGYWNTTSAPTQTMLEQYDIAGSAFDAQLAKLKTLVQETIPAIEQQMEDKKSPWTPDRFPEWDKK